MKRSSDAPHCNQCPLPKKKEARIHVTKQKVSIRVVEGSVLHGLVGGIDQDGHTVLDADIARACDRVQALNEIRGLCGNVEGGPAQLVGGHTYVAIIRVVSHELRLALGELKGRVAD